jgi:hypothetical protein
MTHLVQGWGFPTLVTGSAARNVATPIDSPVSHPPRLEGSELFSTGERVWDFWAWALGDLRMNTVRGFLAEYLVAKAVGSRDPVRVEWADFDVESADGTRIEVKASGLIQSWGRGDSPRTRGYAFKSVHSNRRWDPQLARFITVDPRDRVHVWVFALHTAPTRAEYDPLNLAWWQFRVVPHRLLLAQGQDSGSLRLFDRLGVEPVSLTELPQAIKKARRVNDKL